MSITRTQGSYGLTTSTSVSPWETTIYNPTYYPKKEYSNGYDTLTLTIMEENKNMKNLYNIIVVDLKGYILLDEKVVAENEEEAKFDADVYEIIKESYFNLSDVTIICNKIGTVKYKAD